MPFPVPMRFRSLVAALLLLPLALPAAAQDGDFIRALDEQERMLEDQAEQIRRIEEMMDRMEEQMGGDSPTALPSGTDASPAAAGSPLAGAGAYDPEKAFFPPAPRLASEDGRYSTGLNGFLQLDAAAYSQTGFGEKDFSGGSRVRRASLLLSSVIDQDWIMFLAYDLADGNDKTRAGLRAAAAVYRGASPWWLVAGLFGGSVGLESSTFSTQTSMPERPLIANAFAYAPGAPILGVIATHRGNAHYARLGLYGKGADHDVAGDEGWGLHGRLLWQPQKERRNSTQLGVSGMWRKANKEKSGEDDFLWGKIKGDLTGTATSSVSHEDDCPVRGSFDFDSAGASAVDGSDLVATPFFCDADEYTYLQGEFATAQGPFSFQTEWGEAKVRTKTHGDYKFDGGYVQASAFLTGEARNYNAYFGQFWRVQPRNPLGAGGLGAWEAVARWQTLNLNDRGVKGGEVTGYTVGLNWYMTAFVRTVFNYGRYEVTDRNDKNGPVENGTVDEYLVRVQVEF